MTPFELMQFFDIDKTRVDSLKENSVLLHLAFISVAPTIGSISFVNIVITELVADVKSLKIGSTRQQTKAVRQSCRLYTNQINQVYGKRYNSKQ